MASNTQGLGGLLVVGAVLAVVAITINVSRTGTPSDPDEAIDLGKPNTTAVEDAANGEQNMTASANAHGSLAHANDTDFQQKVLDVDGRVLVDFYADWCGPCRLLTPILEELASEEPAARIVKVNVDNSPNLAAHFRIESIPALIVFENGKPVGRQLGVVNKAQLRTMLGL